MKGGHNPHGEIMNSTRVKASRWVQVMLLTLVSAGMLSASGTEAQVTNPAAVSFAQRLQFTTPEGNAVTVPPGTYQVGQLKDNVLELSSERGVVAEAKAHPFRHTELINTPRVVTVPGNQDEHHLLLLLPNGEGLDAQGWSGDVRPRGGSVFAVPQSAIHSALMQGGINPALRLGPGDLPVILHPQDPTVLFVKDNPNWYCNRKFHPNEDPSVDTDPQTWQVEVNRRKVEYQLAAIVNRLMGSTKTELMKNIPVVDINAPWLKASPYSNSEGGSLLATRLSLYSRTRGKSPSVPVWPWEVGWNRDALHDPSVFEYINTHRTTEEARDIGEQLGRGAIKNDDQLREYLAKRFESVLIMNWWYAQLMGNDGVSPARMKEFKEQPEKIRLWWYADLQRHGGTLPPPIKEEIDALLPQQNIDALPTEDPRKRKPSREWWTTQLALSNEKGKPEDPLVSLGNNADMQSIERIRTLYLLDRLFPAPSTDPNIPEEIRSAMELSLVRFKYWLDEPWTDNPDGEGTFWSENHQIMFASSGFLVGQYMATHHPEWKFRSGLTGSQQMEKVKPRLLRWLDDHLRYGFNEWNSPSYYRYDIAPLLNLVDFSNDQDVQTRATMVLDLLFFDLARLTQKGNLGSTAGRAYPESKFTGWDQSMGDTVQILFGTRCPNSPIYLNPRTPLSNTENAPPPRDRPFGDRYWSANNVDANSLATSDHYQIPMVILAIGHNWNPPWNPNPQFPDRNSYQERARVSVNFDEAEDYGITFDNFDDIIFWWGRGAYLTKYTVDTSLDLIKASNLEQQHDLKDYAPMFEVARKVLEPANGKLSLQDVVNAVSFVTEGMALTRGNLYTYRNGDVMLSSVQNFRKGEMGPQLQAWQATFDNDVVVFSTYPTVQYGSKQSDETNGPVDGGSHDGPNWWAGNAVNPRIVQYEDALIAAYAANQPNRLLRNTIKKDTLGFDPQTHLWWPWAKHDNWPMSKKEPWRVRHFFEDTYVELAAQGHFDPLREFQNRTYLEERVSTADGDGGVWYFASRGNGYIGVFSAQICQATAGDWAGKELLCPNYRNAFIVQVGNQTKFGSFSDFVRIVKDSRINISKGIRKPALDQFGLSDVEVSYDLPWRRDANEPGGWKRRRLELHYDQDTSRLDGAPYCDDGFPRYESPYVAHTADKSYGTIAWGQRQYTLQHGPFKLCHNQATGERAETCP